ncbi:MAG TPA: magnesium transporter [Bacteroidia bacterium]|jgi:magnesium transporter|nr:magnesium transporter [Bacteroidia bacterium]
MQFELSTDLLESLKTGVEKQDDEALKLLLHGLLPADIGETLNSLSFFEAAYMYQLLDEETASLVLIELKEELREEILATLSTKEIAEQIDNLDSDDAADVINELPENRQEEVLSHIEDAELADDVADLLNYEEGTAGSLMAKELVSVYYYDAVNACIDEIRRQADDVNVMYAVYVIGDKEKLIGTLSLKKLIISHPLARIEEIYDKNVFSVNTNTPTEEVAEIMQKYDLVVLPVVDSLGRLVGRITIDDVVDVIRGEETDEAHKMAGIETLDESYMSTSYLGLIKKRAGWLVVLFLGESLTATAMSFFEDHLAKAVILALFVPLIISSGGNTGSQASTLIVRALALGEITFRDWWRIFKRELVVGLTLGLILGVVGFLRVAIWASFVDVYGQHWIPVGLTVGLTLVGVVVWGNLAGSLFPIFLKRAKLDPAVCSAPFVATLVDVTGLIIYFSIATLILKGILL